MAPQAPLDRFLEPLQVDADRAHALSGLFLRNFARLCAESQDQFLPTLVSGSILRPSGGRGQGRYLAIDIGGTNLRVGFIDLFTRDPLNGEHVPYSRDADADADADGPRMQRRLERSWPIDDHLKNDNPNSLFRWIGRCIADVVRAGCDELGLPNDVPLQLGVAFSFPVEQRSLSEATFMSMGKGFAVSSELDLGALLLDGYGHAAAAVTAGGGSALPPIRIAAITNDAVSTLVSFIFRYNESAERRAAMGLILGTGCNATVPLRLGLLHPSKRPRNLSLLPGEGVCDDVRITVNTELSINGTAPPMRELGFITRWDELLDAGTEAPGFQPMEYMTAGRYLGELGRIMLVDYLIRVLGISAETLPSSLLQRHSLTTTFLSQFKPLRPAKLLLVLQREFPESTGAPPFVWTESLAEALYRIAKAIELRAAAIIAAAVLALLILSEELPEAGPAAGDAPPAKREIGVGYTGGCIVHFQDYLVDCQDFIDQLVTRRFGADSQLRVALSPCHDGGITGAGILAAAALSSKTAEMP